MKAILPIVAAFALAALATALIVACRVAPWA